MSSAGQNKTSHPNLFLTEALSVRLAKVRFLSLVNELSLEDGEKITRSMSLGFNFEVVNEPSIQSSIGTPTPWR